MFLVASGALGLVAAAPAKSAFGDASDQVASRRSSVACQFQGSSLETVLRDIGDATKYIGTQACGSISLSFAVSEV